MVTMVTIFCVPVLSATIRAGPGDDPVTIGDDLLATRDDLLATKRTPVLLTIA
jgi:hypothetical protein